MEIIELVRAVVRHDVLAARQWIADARRENVTWSLLAAPHGCDPLEIIVAAAVVELLAERAGQVPPEWTRAVPAASEPVFLLQAAASMPRTRRLCEEEGPEPFRRRRLIAPPEFLTIA